MGELVDDTIPPQQPSQPTPDMRRESDTLPGVGDPRMILASLPLELGVHSRYTLTRMHAEGGLGRVWVAQDETLHREVALKELKPHRAEQTEAGRRFLKEAQITGQLEHPNIVPVYELGLRPDDQQPFYTMRFVRGDTLRKRIAQYHEQRRAGHDDPLALPKLLNAFLNVCQALAYAHSRGVVHRDLKPDNVILGAFGEVLVLDWGLAKLQGEPEQVDENVRISDAADSGVTAAGNVMGTPAYMAPEQAAGKIDAIDARTDVYGLGTILFEMLTGEAPHRAATVGEILQRVVTGPPPRARESRPWIAKPLDAICARAMGQERDERYPSASDLAHDIERYLADQPVSVYREPWQARLGRFLRKHRSAARAAAVSLVLITVISVIAAVLVNEQRRIADEARVAALAAFQREATLRHIADETRNVAIDSLNTLVFDVQERMEDVPALQDLKRDLLETALRGARQVSTQLTNQDAQADELSGFAQVKIADVLVSLGSLDEAEKLYADAYRTFTALAAADRRKMLANRPIAVACDKRGNLALQQGDLAGARRWYDESVKLREELALAAPTDPQSANELAVSFNKLASVELREGKLAEARRRYEQGLATMERLAQAAPADAETQRNLSVSLERVGGLCLRQGDLAAARSFFERALAIHDKLAEQNPANLQFQRDRSVAYNKLGSISIYQGDFPAARKYLDQALAISKQRAMDDPQDVTAQRDWSIAYDSLGDLVSQQGAFAEARQWYDQGLTIALRLAEQAAGDKQVQRDLVVSYNKLGSVASQQREFAAAVKYYESGREIIERLATANPQDALLQRDLSISYTRLGEVQLLQGDLPAARRWFEQGLTVKQALAEADPHDLQAQRGLWTSYFKLGEVCVRQNDLVQGRKFLQQALQISQQLAAAASDNPAVQGELAFTHGDLAAAHEQARDFAAAIKEYEAAIKILEALAQHPTLAEGMKPELARLRKRLQACQAAASDKG